MKTKVIRDEIASDFRALGSLLINVDSCIDNGPLLRAASNIQSKDFLSGQEWGYKLENLRFHFDKPKGVIPKDLDEFVIDLSVYATTDPTCNPDDPFSNLQVNIEKFGTKISCGTILKAAWHLDRHRYDKTNSIHPLYHLQLGGNKIKELEDNLGGTFITTSPRIMHPPMDGIIAIDFVLANYGHDKWKILKEDASYVDLLKRAHERYWAPFFIRLGDHFSNVNQEDCNQASLLCPFLC